MGDLFTLHALWPFLWIWAMAYRPERGWGMSHKSAETVPEAAANASELEDLRRRVAELKATSGREPADGTPAHPDLRLALLRGFKVFRIPVNQWSLATAALGGIIGIVLLLLIMNYNHPFTTNARIYFAVTPVFPSVRGA